MKSTAPALVSAFSFCALAACTVQQPQDIPEQGAYMRPFNNNPQLVPDRPQYAENAPGFYPEEEEDGPYGYYEEVPPEDLPPYGYYPGTVIIVDREGHSHRYYHHDHKSEKFKYPHGKKPELDFAPYGRSRPSFGPNRYGAPQQWNGYRPHGDDRKDKHHKHDAPNP